MPSQTKVKKKRPFLFTENEILIDQLRIEIYESQVPYKEIAAACKLSPSTIQRLASGDTGWPRPSTLFPLLQFLGLHIEIKKGF